MNAPTQQSEITPILGTSMGGGFYAGRINIAGTVYALIAAPKAEGEKDEIEYNADWRTSIEGAKSFNDGLVNTNAMADAGSDLAKWARGLTIGGRKVKFRLLFNTMGSWHPWCLLLQLHCWLRTRVRH